MLRCVFARIVYVIQPSSAGEKNKQKWHTPLHGKKGLYDRETYSISKREWSWNNNNNTFGSPDGVVKLSAQGGHLVGVSHNNNTKGLSTFGVRDFVRRCSTYVVCIYINTTRGAVGDTDAEMSSPIYLRSRPISYISFRVLTYTTTHTIHWLVPRVFSPCCAIKWTRCHHHLGLDKIYCDMFMS